MSKEVKRYFVDCHRLHSGDKTQDECDVRVVLASDYDALLAERNRLRDALGCARKEAIYGLRHAKNHLQAAAALGRISEGAEAAMQGEQP